MTEMHAGYRIPVVSVVGKSGSGKTTLLEKLIRELTSRGYRVATVKHHVHEFDIDVPGKDSWRHARAGAAVTMISAPDKFGIVRKVDRERTLGELVEAAGDVDILLTEGFRRAGDTRVEVLRRACSREPICTAGELWALVTDVPEAVPAGVAAFGFDGAVELADVIEVTFLGHAGRGVGRADARPATAVPMAGEH